MKRAVVGIITALALALALAAPVAAQGDATGCAELAATLAREAQSNVPFGAGVSGAATTEAGAIAAEVARLMALFNCP